MEGRHCFTNKIKRLKSEKTGFSYSSMKYEEIIVMLLTFL